MENASSNVRNESANFIGLEVVEFS